jgi:hypothetical protein
VLACVLGVTTLGTQAPSPAASSVPLLTDTSFGRVKVGMSTAGLQKTGLVRVGKPYICDLDPGTKWTVFKLKRDQDSYVYAIKGRVVGYFLYDNWKARNGLSSTSTLQQVLDKYGARAKLQAYNEVFATTQVVVTGGPTYSTSGESVTRRGISAEYGQRPYCE